MAAQMNSMFKERENVNHVCCGSGGAAGWWCRSREKPERAKREGNGNRQDGFDDEKCWVSLAGKHGGSWNTTIAAMVAQGCGKQLCEK